MEIGEFFKIEIRQRPLTPKEMKRRAEREFFGPYRGEEHLKRALQDYQDASQKERRQRGVLY